MTSAPQIIVRLIFICGLALLLAFAGTSVQAEDNSSKTVTSTGDDANDETTLRGAIAAVDDGGTIDFNLSGDTTITLLTEDIDITKSLTIDGSNNGNPVTVQVATPGAEGSKFRVFEIGASGKTVNISNMTIMGGDISSLGGAGGSVYVTNGALTLENVTVQGSKGAMGGGIYVLGEPTLTLKNSTITGCKSSQTGAGIYSRGTLTVSMSTLSGNQSSGKGGGMYLSLGWRTVTITNSTIANNSASGDGEGLYLSTGTLSISNTILANNAIYDYYYSSGTLTDNGYNVVGNSNVASNASGGFNAPTSILYNTRYGENVTGDTAWSQGDGDLTNQNLNLSDTLADNGGPTQTLALSTGSFGIDAIVSFNTWNNSPVNGQNNFEDQRGTITESSSAISIGAYSAAPPMATTQDATNKSQTGATLNGTVNANPKSATVQFEYGEDTNYGTQVTADQSPVTGASDSSVSKAISALTASTTYHYRVCATSTDGTSCGVDKTFATTDSPAPSPTTSPVASAGPDQTVKSGTTVYLNGSGSKATAASATIDTWAWTKASGPANPTINNSTSQVASITPATDGTYIYKITVTDSNGKSASDTCVVNVSANKPPIARASGYAAISGSSASVTLEGATSVARDGAGITAYAWTQLSGPASPSLSGANSSQASCSTSTEGAYVYKLTVTDSNGLQNTDTVTVNVLFNNTAPTAQASASSKVDPGAAGVRLNGSGSTDSDGTIAAYSWTQLKGAAVTITNPDQAVATFNAPASDTGLLFLLTVTDNDGAQDSVEVAVNVTTGSVPDADAGAGQSTSNGQQVYLNGCDSTGNSLTFAWKQTSGPTVTLYNADTCKPYFYAQTVSSQSRNAAGGVAAQSVLSRNAAGGVAAQSVRTASTTSCAFELLVTDSSGFMSISETSVTVSSSSSPSPTPTPTPITLSNELLLWRNGANGKVCFWRIDVNGKLADTQQGSGWDYVSDNLTMDETWDLEGMLRVDGARTLIWRSSDTGEVRYWRLDDDGRILNETENSGWGAVSDKTLDAAWSYGGGLEVDGRPTIFWQPGTNTKVAYWRLGSDARLENRTLDDGWGWVTTDFPYHDSWRLLDAVSINGKPTLLWRSTVSNKIVSWQLDAASGESLAVSNLGEGPLDWQFVSDTPVGTNWTLKCQASIGDVPTLFWLDSQDGKVAYWRLNQDATIRTADTRPDWGLVNADFTLKNGWDIIGQAALDTGENLFLFNQDSGKVATWLVNSSDATYESWGMVNSDNAVSPDWQLNRVDE